MILGINDMADPSVSLVKNGQLIFYIEEERLNRVKHSHNIFPIRSIKAALKYYNISFNEIEYIAYNWNFKKYENGSMENFFRRLNKEYNSDVATKKWQRERLKKRNLENFKKKVFLNLKKNFNIKKLPKIKFYSHHYVHAFQSHYQSGFKNSICITIDGSGEENCTVVWKFENGKHTKLEEINMPHSLGWYFAAFTEYLGFKAYDGEYKLMGLASYGKYIPELEAKIEKILKFDNKSSYRIDPQFIHYGKHSYSGRFTDNLVKLFNKRPRKENDKITDWHKNLAYAVQKKLELVVTNMFKKYAVKTGIKNFCLGGGVGLNVKMNSEIYQLDNCKRLFANPLCADNGASAGSALLADFKINKNKPKILNNLNLGLDFSDNQILELLNSKKISFTKPIDLEKIIANELKKGKIIGWFQGRMEAGARALGYRSILGDPRKKKMAKKINKIIKYRELWRPFCPSILENKVKTLLKGSFDSKFMTVSFEASEKLKSIAPAIVHVDETCRIQSVSKKDNLRFYKLINEFYKITGVPVVLNTSFNIKGEPIVCTPNDAIKTFYSTGLDFLVLNDYIIRKK